MGNFEGMNLDLLLQLSGSASIRATSVSLCIIQYASGVGTPIESDQNFQASVGTILLTSVQHPDPVQRKVSRVTTRSLGVPVAMAKTRTAFSITVLRTRDLF
jgi:hypothetical protein